MNDVHLFHALAFVENFSLKELAAHFPEAKRAQQHLWYAAVAGGYQALELKLRSVQDALSLLTEVARDRRLVLLETSVIALILLEIVLSLVRH